MKIQTVVGFTAMSVVAGLWGCSSSHDDSNDSTRRSTGVETSGSEHAGQCGHEGGRGEAMAGMCPMAVEGTRVTSADVEGGAAIMFTTSTGDVAELRRRVAHIAEMHAHHAGCSMMGTETPMPETTVTFEEIESGARLVLRPTDPANVEPVRAHVRDHTARMANGECPMMRQGEHGGCGMGHGEHDGCGMGHGEHAGCGMGHGEHGGCGMGQSEHGGCGGR